MINFGEAFKLREQRISAMERIKKRFDEVLDLLIDAKRNGADDDVFFTLYEFIAQVRSSYAMQNTVIMALTAELEITRDALIEATIVLKHTGKMN